ncbi:MAG: hypothetical protein WA172_13690 [Terriglobales bacterium]
MSHEQALRHFTGGARGIAVGILQGRPRSIAGLYIPYRLYRVRITNGGREESRIYALDAVEGTLDWFAFPELPAERELVTINTRNFVPSRLTAEQTTEKLIDKVRRVLFLRGFVRLRDLRMEATAVEGDFYLPYWICFRGNNAEAKLEILDALRRRSEGAKVCRLVQDWLQSSSKNKFENRLSHGAVGS